MQNLDGLRCQGRTVKSRDPFGGSQLKKELSLQAKPFSPAISHAFPSSSSQLIKSGAECKAYIIRAPCKVSISTSSVYHSTTRRQQKDKDELGECYFGQLLKSEARTTVSSAQFPSIAPRDNVPIISEAQSEVKRGSPYKAPGSQGAPLQQRGRVNLALQMTSNLYDYRSSGIGQRYFPDETIDEPGLNHALKTTPVFLLYSYSVKYDDLFLPRSEFSRDRLKFKLFISNFETHVESKLHDRRAFLCLLVQHCTDSVKEKIQHFSETGQNCYRLAKDRLFKEYVSPWIVSDVCEQRLKKFPSILSGDAKELKRFAELLEKCSVIVKDIICYSNLDSLDTLTLLVKKLPYNLRTRWVKRAVRVESRSGKLANFSHFSQFVQQESEETNFLFGLRSLNVKPSTSKVKAASCTTTSFNSSDRELKAQNRWGECWYCKSSTHRLIDCKEFTKISIEDRFEFIKRSRLYYKCFSSKHQTPNAKRLILTR